jgi:hypothetical protein
MDSHKPDKVEQDPSFKIDSIEEYKEVQDIKLKHWVITTIVKVGVVLLLAFGTGMLYFMIKNPDQANLLTGAFESVIKVITTIIEAS